MSRRAATFTQADVARALRAAQQVGPDWKVEIAGGTIRLTRDSQVVLTAESPPEPVVEPEPEQKWRF
jgi:hypothetical protein